MAAAAAASASISLANQARHTAVAAVAAGGAGSSYFISPEFLALRMSLAKKIVMEESTNYGGGFDKSPVRPHIPALPAPPEMCKWEVPVCKIT